VRPRSRFGNRGLASVALVAAVVAAAYVSEPRAAPAAAGWQRVNALPGLLLHDGCARGASHVVLVGEQAAPTAGLVLESTDGGVTFTRTGSFPQALHLRAVTVDGRGRLLVAGDTTAGRGLLLRARGAGRWQRLRIPARVTELDAVAAIGRTILVAGEAGDRAVMVASPDAGVSWREPVRIRPAGPRFARFADLAVKGSHVVAVGGDGVRGIVVVSGDDGASFRRLRPPRTLAVANAVAFAPGSDLYVGGSRHPGGAGAGGAVLLRLHGGAWSTVPIPMSAAVTDLLFAGRRAYGTQVSRGPDAILASSDGGRSWHSERVQQPASVTLERLFAARGGRIFAVGTGGLYRNPE
jgi:photosystem II stability/assembly factor-like uncharacterized protein